MRSTRNIAASAKARLMALLTVLIALTAAAVACTSNDTLFIRLTETPIPSLTPTPLTVITQFHKGDMVTLVGAELNLELPSRAGSTNALDMSKLQCFRDTLVKILDVGHSAIDPKDTTIFYQVQCPGVKGWVPEYRLTVLKKSQDVVVKVGGSRIFQNPDSNADTGVMCPAGTRVNLGELIANPNRGVIDTNVYANITCGGQTGYLLANTVSAAAPAATPADLGEF